MMKLRTEIYQIDNIDNPYTLRTNNSEIEALLMLFNKNIEYQIFSPAMVSQAITKTNMQACEKGIDYYIERMHIDTNGGVVIFARGIIDQFKIETIHSNEYGFPAGQPGDFYGNPVIRTSFSPIESSDIDSDLFPYIPSPEENVWMVEEKVIDYLIDNYDANSIRKCGSYIYDVIEQKISDFADEVAHNTLHDKVSFVDYNEKTYSDKLKSIIPVNTFFKVVKDILQGSIT